MQPFDHVVDMRLLELRSGLFFEYPKLNLAKKNLLFFLPFWENPIISESKEARLVEYDVINRGSSLFAHTGASARSISIEFYLTIPHIMQSVNSVLNSQRLITSLSTEKEKGRFRNINPFEMDVKTSVVQRQVERWQTLMYESHAGLKNPPIMETVVRGQEEHSSWGQSIGVLAPGFENQVPADNWPWAEQRVREPDAPFFLQKPPPEPPAFGITNISNTSLRALNTAVFILETIRTCVAGNSQTTVLGPPVLRLRHGASYNDVPLICRDYDIGVEEDAGYDLKTLLPNRIRITLNTAELRTGDFNEFKPGVPVARDTLAGWEALATHGTTDPGPLKGGNHNAF